MYVSILIISAHHCIFISRLWPIYVCSQWPWRCWCWNWAPDTGQYSRISDTIGGYNHLWAAPTRSVWVQQPYLWQQFFRHPGIQWLPFAIYAQGNRTPSCQSEYKGPLFVLLYLCLWWSPICVCGISRALIPGQVCVAHLGCICFWVHQ